jgi:ATP-dependent Clp protease ATP-binding subunit ClpA
VISQELEIALHDSFLRARECRHKWITAEHLLLRLLDSPRIRDRLPSHSIDPTALRAQLEDRVSRTEQLPPKSDDDTQPTMEFQRLIQRAILSVQESGRTEVTPLDIFDAVATNFMHLVQGSPSQGPDAGRVMVEMNARVCSLCGTAALADNVTVLEGRGVLCAECVDAVLKAKRSA